MRFDFQTKTPVSNILYACLSSDSMIWVKKTQKNPENSLFINFHQIFVVSYTHADSVAMYSNQFLLCDWHVPARVLPIGLAVTQKLCFLGFQSEETKTNSHY